MKKQLRAIAFLLALLLLCGCAGEPSATDAPSGASDESVAGEPAETGDTTTWLEEHAVSVELTPSEATVQNRKLAETLYEQFLTVPPVDFLYGGERFSETMDAWERTEQSTENGRTVTYTHGETGVAVQLDYRFYDDSSALEWGVRIENGGAENSRTIESFSTLSMQVASKGSTKLFYSKGGNAKADDFAPQTYALKNGESCKIFPLRRSFLLGRDALL